MPLKPAFSNFLTFCFLKMFSGVPTIWTLLRGWKRRGIQNVRVFPIPIPAMDTTLQFHLRTASTTLSCQRHGLMPKTSEVQSQICKREGKGSGVIWGEAIASIKSIQSSMIQLIVDYKQMMWCNAIVIGFEVQQLLPKEPPLFINVFCQALWRGWRKLSLSEKSRIIWVILISHLLILSPLSEEFPSTSK